MRVLLWLVAGGLVLYGLRRLALWMESRGWVYYRHKPSSSTLGNAFLEVHSLLEPGQEKVLEVMREDEADEQPSGEPPEPGRAPGGDEPL